MSATERETYLNNTAQVGDTIGKVATAAVTGLGNAFGAAQAATDSNLTKGVDFGIDTAGGILSQFGGIAPAGRIPGRRHRA